MLAILTLGPAYGSQLLSEFQRRAVHRPPVNVGQAYSTLDRLTKQRLVQNAGKTDDGLTLFSLTDAGKIAAEAWLLHAPEEIGGDDWEEMLDRVLISRSLPNHPHSEVVNSYIRAWTKRLNNRGPTIKPTLPQDRDDRSLTAQAETLIANAALDWLERVSRTSATALDYPAAKPLRGRRPHPTTG
jgi:DNA-binding PadR family transcriptional regulator